MNRFINAIPLLLVFGLIFAKDKTSHFLDVSTKNGNTCSVVARSIYDGDTLKIDCTGTITKIRLCGIDAPEKAQPLGIEARDKLRQLLKNLEVEFYPIETDRYNRTVAELFVKTGSDEEIFINAEMVRTGLAFHYEKYSGNCPNQKAIIDAEEIAKKNKSGVWNLEPAHVKPWDFRRQK